MLPVLELAEDFLDLVRDVHEAIVAEIGGFAPWISQHDQRPLVPEYVVEAVLFVRNQVVTTRDRLVKANVVHIVRLSGVMTVRFVLQVDVHEQHASAHEQVGG